MIPWNSINTATPIAGFEKVQQPRSVVLSLAGDDRPVQIGKYGEEGHYFTAEDGHVLFIPLKGGFVPLHLRAEARESKRFTRAAIEKKLIQHHEEYGGGHTAHADSQLANFQNPFKFRGVNGKLPEEVTSRLDKHSAARHLFEIAKPGETAQGEDAMGELGHDRYMDIANGMAEGKLTAAKKFAEHSPDPEVQFLNSVHDNLPTETTQSLRSKATKIRNQAAGKPHEQRAKLLAEAEKHETRAREAGGQKSVPVEAGKLRVGNEFKVHGVKFRVAEDEQGNRVLHGGTDYAETPLDALRSVPVDEGSFKAGRSARSRVKIDAIPFSAAPVNAMRLIRFR